MSIPTHEQKRTRLFIVLSGIFVTNALVAEMIGVKLFSAEATFGFNPAQINVFGNVMDFNLTAGAVIWPVVFITSDLINEYFGRPGVKRISYLTAALIAYAFVVIFITRHLDPAQIWLDAYPEDDAGNTFNINYAFDKIFGQGQRIIIGSILAFLIGQLVDAFTFHKLKQATGHKKLWLRATGSTLVSQLIDSFVVIYYAFTGTFSNDLLISIALTNYVYKFSVAILLTPLIYLGHYIIDRYLGKSYADELNKESNQDNEKFF